MIDASTELHHAEKQASEVRSALVSFPEFFHSAMRRSNHSDSRACRMFEVIRVSNRPTLCSMNVRKASPFKEIFNIKYVLTTVSEV